MSIGSRIKERREALGITQVELARLIGVTKGAIGNYETDANSPKASILYKVFEVLQCDANYLFQDGTTNITTQSIMEENLLMSFRQLNTEGQEKAIDYVNDLLDTGKYIKIHSAGMAKEA